MITISKAKLEQDMKGYLRLVEEKGEELIVTDNQVPVLKVVPLPRKASVEDVFRNARGRVKYYADINEPTVDEWPEV